MQMFVKHGKTYWKPTSSGDGAVINGISKWEQAFRVFSDIYTRAHPNRATEVIQYNHIIHTTATAYIWENVYLYDKDFRIHMVKYPARNWGIILQQAWNLRLKDKLRMECSVAGTSSGNRSSTNSSGGSFNPQDFCKRFNKGRCTYRQSCRFEHRCYYCGKWGHGVVNCRLLKADSQQNRDFKKGDGRRDRYDRSDRYDRHDNRNERNDKRTDNKTKTK